MSTPPLIRDAALSGFVFDRAAANVHVMQPLHTLNIVSSRGREEGQLTLAHNVPAGGPLAFNTDGFVDALRNVLAANTAGYAMELREHGQIIASEVHGSAHLPADGAAPWAENTCMHIASCSKLVTAIALTRALAAAHLTPDTPIISYLPTYWQKGPNIEKITFRMLMTHTSGFHVKTSDSTYPWMKGQVAAGVKTADMGVYFYQNMNYGLCRLLIPIMLGNIAAGHAFPPATLDSDWDFATIQAYSTYVKQTVLQPSGVADATLDHPAPDALAYSMPTGAGWNSGDLSTYAGGAGWHMSVTDLLNVMGTARRAGTILPPSATQTMIDGYFGIDVITPTPLGNVYNKNGLWQSKDGPGAQIEQTLAYFLPLDMELVVFANSPISAANTFFRDMVTNLYAANIAPQVGTGTWIAHHNMTGDQYQQTFNNLVLNEGMQLVDFSVYGTNGELLAAIWAKSANPPAWEAHHGLNSAQYQAMFNQLTSQGYGLALVNGYPVAGQPTFAAIFQKGLPGGWEARANMPAPVYQQNFTQFQAQGFVLDWVSGYSSGGQAYYSAIWRRMPGAPAWQAKHGLTTDQYQQFFTQMTGQGFMPVVVSGYGIGNQPYYAAIFRKIPNPPAWMAHHGMTADQYQQTFNQLVTQGYHLKQVSAYTVGPQNLFAAIWSK